MDASLRLSLVGHRGTHERVTNDNDGVSVLEEIGNGGRG